MISNNARVARALYLLKLDLDNFVAREFTNYHQDQTLTVLNQILGQSRDSQKPFQNMKTQDLLTVVQASWWNVFDRAMGGIEPGVVREVALTHEAWAARNSFNGESAFHALNSVERLLAAMSSPSTLELDMLKRECLESELETAEPEAEDGAVSDDLPTDREELSDEADAIIEGDPVPAGHETDVPVAGSENEAAANDEDPYLADLIRSLKEAGALRDEDLVATAARAGSQAQYADDSHLQELSPSLVQALGEHGMRRIFGYQGEVLSHILAGSDVALEAGRATDETVTLALPLAESLLRNPGSHGLVLCPDEESARLLEESLNPLLSAAGVRITSDAAEVAGSLLESGETIQSAVLVVSVDSLNRSLATLREDWQPLLKALKFIAIYRAEEYQGYFGANVAVLLRRLAHRLAVLGASHRCLVVAQGCANGIELAWNLTGQNFQAVSGHGRPAARRHFIAASPRDPEGPGQVDLPDRVARAALACVAKGRSVLVCCSGENLAQMAFYTAQEMAEGSGVDAGSLSLAEDSWRLGTGPFSEEAGEAPGPQAVFAAFSREVPTLTGNVDGVIVAGSFSTPRAAHRLLESVGVSEEDEAFALFYTPNDTEGRFTARNIEALLAKEPDQVVVDPDSPDVVSLHLPALVNESAGSVYSFSREALGNTVFQALRREAALLGNGEETEAIIVSLHPAGEQRWGLWLDGRQVSSLSPYGKFREIYSGSVMALEGRKYRVASMDPGDGGDRPPAIVLEGAEALANLRTVPSFSESVAVEEESLCLSLTPGVSLHLGRVAVQEELDTVSVIDDSGSPEVYDEGLREEDHQELVTATFAPDEDAKWSMYCQAFWLDVSGPVNGDATTPRHDEDSAAAPVIAALEQMFRVGARFTFPVGKYDLATYSQGSTIFLAEVSPESLGIVKKAFDNWRDILRAGADVARNCRCAKGCVFCLFPSSPYDRPLDKSGGLALADRLLEITLGS